MKEWPEDEEKTVSFEDLIDPVRKALLEAYKVTSRRKKFVKYDGYNFGTHSLATNPSPDWHLSAEGIKYHRERDRDTLDTILMIAFNMGQRVEKRTTKFYERLYDRMKEDYDALAKKPGRSAQRS